MEPLKGWAQVAGNEARAPNIEVRNRSGKPVKYVELGWVLTRPGGPAVRGRVAPFLRPGLYLPPDKTGTVRQDTHPAPVLEQRAAGERAAR